MKKPDTVAAAGSQEEAKLIREAGSALVNIIKELKAEAAPNIDESKYRFLFPLGISKIHLNLTVEKGIEIEISGGELSAKGPSQLREFSDEYLDTAPDEIYLDAAFPKVESHLELPTTGIYGTHTAERRWGTKRTIKAIEAVGKAWNAKHPDLRFGIGDISKKGGGPISGHASHQHGVDFDVRPLRSDKQEDPVVWQDSNYSRSLTKELIQMFIDNGIAPVKVIFFNDPKIGIDKVHKWPNHDNHFHVRFELG